MKLVELTQNAKHLLLSLFEIVCISPSIHILPDSIPGSRVSARLFRQRVLYIELLSLQTA